MHLFRRRGDFSFMLLAIGLVFGGPFLGIGLYEAYKSGRTLGRFQAARGVVVANTYTTTNDGGNISGAYQPVVEFKGADGQTVRFTDGAGSLPPDYEVGAHVEVLYNPDNANDARLRSWKRLWLVPTILCIVGLLPISVCIFLARVTGPKL